MQCSRYWLKMTTNTVALGALDSEGQRLVREYDLTRPVKFRHVRWLSLYSFIMCCCQWVCLNLIRSGVCSVTGYEGLPSRHLAWCAWSSRRNMLMCVPSFQILGGRRFLPQAPRSYPIPMAHRATPGKTEVTPGTKSYWHTGTTPSFVWQTK